MVKMNKTLAYGLACLHYLDNNESRDWLRVSEIARLQNLPAAYCNKVLQALVRAALVDSQKGKGYRLRKKLDDINVWELMEALTFNHAPEAGKKELTIKLYETLREEVNHWLVGLTVRDIVEMMKEEERRKAEHPAEE
ncbi:MAG: Rrf2 family transcriptional regulator [Elusimicrobia bacterium]|nr:Rrf2 family transcriptional regulator [Elusimicrobiota bacterium]